MNSGILHVDLIGYSFAAVSETKCERTFAVVVIVVTCSNTVLFHYLQAEAKARCT